MNKSSESNNAVAQAALIIQAAWRGCAFIRNSCRVQEDDRNHSYLKNQSYEKNERNIRVNNLFYHEYEGFNEKQKEEESFLSNNADYESIPYESKHSATHRIQNIIGKEEKTSSSDEIIYPKCIHRMSRREEVVKIAFETAQAHWQQQVIELEDVEIVKLLEALQLISSTNAKKHFMC